MFPNNNKDALNQDKRGNVWFKSPLDLFLVWQQDMWQSEYSFLLSMIYIILDLKYNTERSENIIVY